MGGLADAFDLKDENEAKDYLDTLGVEYRFQCYHEKRPDGCHRLGDFLEAFRPDMVKARKVYETNCIENNYGHSCFKAGNYNLIGRGGEKNYKKALEFFKQGCDNDYSDSCHNSGLLLTSGLLEAGKDFVASAEYFKRGCDQQNGASCQDLSTNYIMGKPGLDKDMSLAFKFAQKGCDVGHMYSCANISVMYKKGDGVAKDLALSEQYKTRAKQLRDDSSENVTPIKFGE